MTKEELNVRVNNLLGIINAANDEIRSRVNGKFECIQHACCADPNNPVKYIEVTE